MQFLTDKLIVFFLALLRPQNSQTFPDSTQFSQTFKALKSLSYFSQTLKDLQRLCEPHLSFILGQLCSRSQPPARGSKSCHCCLDRQSAVMAGSSTEQINCLDVTQTSSPLVRKAGSSRFSAASDHLWVTEPQAGRHFPLDLWTLVTKTRLYQALYDP